MKNGQGLDLVWWITVVELPALASLFWLSWRNHLGAEGDIDDLRHAIDVGLANQRQCLDAYKLEVAKNYVSTRYLRDVEERITSHLIRIEDKLDASRNDGAGGGK